ncbi:MAG: hypothetical protein L6Q75_20020 [Burkholderiaceae bacterium]|nr:hypothetical protein [Burkholderiaceae bacterium]
MNNYHDDTRGASEPHEHAAAGTEAHQALGEMPDTTGHDGRAHGTERTPRRGLTNAVHARELQSVIWLRTLLLADRFRVMRTIDVAVHCFAERPFKAALSAAQRAMRGLVKAKLLARYRTDRFMTVYGLTQRGVTWIQERGHAASASVRRVTDMTNPEHRLWAQFLVLCAEARGLHAMTENELAQKLARGFAKGLLTVCTKVKGRQQTRSLRPDAVAIEADGITWFEVDRSARGSDRAAALRSLVLSMGADTQLKAPLRRVVVLTRTDRIHARVIAALDRLVTETAGRPLEEGVRRLRRRANGVYEVQQTISQRLGAGSRLVDVLAGYVLVQALPVNLPRVRLDGRGGITPSGWFEENELPYRRPLPLGTWTRPASPLVGGNGPTGLPPSESSLA